MRDVYITRRAAAVKTLDVGAADKDAKILATSELTKRADPLDDDADIQELEDLLETCGRPRLIRAEK